MSGPGRESPDERRARQRAEVRALAERLQERVEDLAPILLPEGGRQGHDWRAGARGSKSIVLRGPYRGVYRDFEGGGKGCDMLQAVAELLCNGSLREAIEWARSYLGEQPGGDRAFQELALQRARERREAQERDAAAQNIKRRKQAAGLWHGAVPIMGTPADDYLRGRGIHLDRLARPPGALRYHSAAWCAERRGNHPAMVAALFRFEDSKLCATHRTYLDQAPGGGWDKAAIESPRSILGSWPGAVIPLQRGETDVRWKDYPEGEVIALGEGIEEGLSIALVQPEWRVGAVGFVGNFGRLDLPRWCHLMLCINNDPPGSQAERAVFGDPDKGTPGAIENLEARGHVVRALRPPAGFKDWNDLLTGKRSDGG